MKQLNVTSTAAALLLSTSLLSFQNCGSFAPQDLTMVRSASSTSTTTSSTSPDGTTASPSSPVSSTGTANALVQRKGIVSGLAAYSIDDLPIAIARIKASKAGWIRMAFNWSDIQPDGPNTYNLDAYDRAATAAAANGVKILGIIAFTPPWARAAGTTKFCPPTQLTEFSAFASFLAKRYGPMGVHTWEIWNEENSVNFWQPAPSPTIYAALLGLTYTALKAADPAAFIVMGGMAPASDSGGINQNPRTFLKNIYAAGAKDSFDAAAFHPYTYPALPSSQSYNNWAQMAVTNPSMRSIMIENGDVNKKIWMTEFGFPTMPSNPALTEAQQAAYFLDAYQTQATYDWSGPLFSYTLTDNPVQSPTNSEDWYGFFRPDGTSKPAWDIFSMIAD